jgi:thiol-disulfide isomerase/thioredoxin
MKTYPKVFLLFAYLLMCIGSYAGEHTQDTIARIKIRAKEYKNQAVDFYGTMYVHVCQVKLDSNGEGSAIIPIKRKQFDTFYINGMKRNVPVFLDYGYELVFSADKESLPFSGKGSVINNYLFESNILLNQLRDSARSIEDPLTGIDKFIRLCDHFEAEHAGLYKKYYDNILPTKELDYLLRANMRASVLLQKEFYLSDLTHSSDFGQKEIDSLNLENRLGLAENNLLHDTLLIRCPSSDFSLYLHENRNRYFLKSGCFKPEDMDLKIILKIKAVENASQYGGAIKEFLLFQTLFNTIEDEGPLPIIDSITGSLIETHRLSAENRKLLADKKKEYIYLMPGKPAPHLQGISPEGKVYSLSDFKGKVIFIDLWATWCSPCIAALPHILELEESFKHNKEVIFIFLANNKEDTWKGYLSQHPEFIGFHLRIKQEDSRTLEKSWKLAGIPRYMLIDKEGKIIDAFAKNNSYDKLKGMIEKALLK